MSRRGECGERERKAKKDHYDIRAAIRNGLWMSDV